MKFSIRWPQNRPWQIETQRRLQLLASFAGGAGIRKPRLPQPVCYVARAADTNALDTGLEHMETCVIECSLDEPSIRDVKRDVSLQEIATTVELRRRTRHRHQCLSSKVLAVCCRLRYRF